MVQIKQTTDYEMFKTKRGNRSIMRGAVNKLIVSIRRNNLLPVNPIIVNSRMEIIDGQHRLQAAMREKIPIYYVEFDPASLPEIQLLKATTKVWTFKDFMDSYIALGRRDYQIFKDYWLKYELPYSTTLQLLGSGISRYGSNKKIHQEFKEGTFKVKDLDEAIEFAEDIQSLLAFSHNSVKSSVRFYESVAKSMKQFPNFIKDVEAKMVGTKTRIYRCESNREYLRQFEDILNYKHVGKPIRLM